MGLSLGLLVVLATGLGLIVSCGGEEPREGPPSVILISLDTLRADHVGFMGYDRDTTPFLDEVAKEAMVFDRAYTTMSWTLIAHMSLMTGMYPSQHKVWKDDSVLPESIPTLTQRLKERGYHTMGFHYPGWLNASYGFGRDFDIYQKHHNVIQAGAHMREAMANMRAISKAEKEGKPLPPAMPSGPDMSLIAACSTDFSIKVWNGECRPAPRPAALRRPVLRAARRLAQRRGRSAAAGPL